MSYLHWEFSLVLHITVNISLDADANKARNNLHITVHKQENCYTEVIGDRTWQLKKATRYMGNLYMVTKVVTKPCITDTP